MSDPEQLREAALGRINALRPYALDRYRDELQRIQDSARSASTESQLWDVQQRITQVAETIGRQLSGLQSNPNYQVGLLSNWREDAYRTELRQHNWTLIGNTDRENQRALGLGRESKCADVVAYRFDEQGRVQWLIADPKGADAVWHQSSSGQLATTLQGLQQNDRWQTILGSRAAGQAPPSPSNVHLLNTVRDSDWETATSRPYRPEIAGSQQGIQNGTVTVNGLTYPVNAEPRAILYPRLPDEVGADQWAVRGKLGEIQHLVSDREGTQNYAVDASTGHGHGGTSDGGSGGAGGSADPIAGVGTSQQQPSSNVGQSNFIGRFSIPNDAVYWERNAEVAYNEIRSSGLAGCAAVAANTGIPQRIVEDVFRHVFWNSHEEIKSTGVRVTLERFSPNGEIADLWIRAVRNDWANDRTVQNFKDLILHERTEMQLEQIGLPFRNYQHPGLDAHHASPKSQQEITSGEYARRVAEDITPHLPNTGAGGAAVGAAAAEVISGVAGGAIVGYEFGATALAVFAAAAAALGYTPDADATETIPPDSSTGHSTVDPPPPTTNRDAGPPPPPSGGVVQVDKGPAGNKEPVPVVPLVPAAPPQPHVPYQHVVTSQDKSVPGTASYAPGAVNQGDKSSAGSGEHLSHRHHEQHHRDFTPRAYLDAGKLNPGERPLDWLGSPSGQDAVSSSIPLSFLADPGGKASPGVTSRLPLENSTGRHSQDRTSNATHAAGTFSDPRYPNASWASPQQLHGSLPQSKPTSEPTQSIGEALPSEATGVLNPWVAPVHQQSATQIPNDGASVNAHPSGPSATTPTPVQPHSYTITVLDSDHPGTQTVGAREVTGTTGDHRYVDPVNGKEYPCRIVAEWHHDPQSETNTVRMLENERPSGSYVVLDRDDRMIESHTVRNYTDNQGNVVTNVHDERGGAVHIVESSRSPSGDTSRTVSDRDSIGAVIRTMHVDHRDGSSDHTKESYSSDRTQRTIQHIHRDPGGGEHRDQRIERGDYRIIPGGNEDALDSSLSRSSGTAQTAAVSNPPPQQTSDRLTTTSGAQPVQYRDSAGHSSSFVYPAAPQQAVPTPGVVPTVGVAQLVDLQHANASWTTQVPQQNSPDPHVALRGENEMVNSPSGWTAPVQAPAILDPWTAPVDGGNTEMRSDVVGSNGPDLGGGPVVSNNRDEQQEVITNYQPSGAYYTPQQETKTTNQTNTNTTTQHDDYHYSQGSGGSSDGSATYSSSSGSGSSGSSSSSSASSSSSGSSGSSSNYSSSTKYVPPPSDDDDN